jgi:hypothetical protein
MTSFKKMESLLTRVIATSADEYLKITFAVVGRRPTTRESDGIFLKDVIPINSYHCN